VLQAKVLSMSGAVPSDAQFGPQFRPKPPANAVVAATVSITHEIRSIFFIVSS
jgi:hypothetical protein